MPAAATGQTRMIAAPVHRPGRAGGVAWAGCQRGGIPPLDSPVQRAKQQDRNGQFRSVHARHDHHPEPEGDGNEREGPAENRRYKNGTA